MILIKDSEFIRGNCPMTKEDIRALSIWKMNLNEYSKVLDIGSGTGTISIQASMIASKGWIYSIEKDEEAYNISLKNINKFNCENIIIEKANAIDAITSYIKQDMKFNSIFIGGSGGYLEKIIELSDKILKDDGTIVLNFITLNNVYIAVEKLKSIGYKVDISMVNISKNKDDSYMMIANNPIYIVQSIRGEV